MARTEKSLKALVYLSAYIVEGGGSLGDLHGWFSDPPLVVGLVNTTLVVDGSDQAGTDVSVDELQDGEWAWRQIRRRLPSAPSFTGTSLTFLSRRDARVRHGRR